MRFSFVYHYLFFLGEPYFEKEKAYPHYHRSPKQQLRRYKSSEFSDISTEIPSNHIQNPLKRRAKRQIDYDHMAKHVEVLVAYDESIKEFHSDADIKSYILTLFSYVSFCLYYKLKKTIFLLRCHIYILMQVLGIILKSGWLN
jgi:hypothetical protein